MLCSQFERRYVYLSRQKFSSHVIEKLLKCFEESRSRIINELVSEPHFDQLLQDPFANYVIQSALGVTKGSVRALLLHAVRPHTLLLRTSPYCKKIFSRRLLKK
ncbi:putative pumilio -like protein 7, chloroplastic [Capsicum baccatum]|nr:putative pumilio -like protein 7, chloroplastic [Capsicum baccatum]